VMDRLSGSPLGAAGPVLRALGPAGRREAATALLESALDQVLEHGLVHVDLHPGNVLVRPDGSLGLLDLGSVGRLDGTTRTAVGRLLAALGGGDSLAATDALLELVDRPEEISERELERGLGALLVRFAVPGTTTGITAFTAVFGLVTEHRLTVPPQVAAVFRTFATLEGTLTTIDPTFDLVAAAREAGRHRIARALTPRELRRSAEQELMALLPVLRRLPRRIDRIADTVERGRLSVDVRLLADRRDRRLVTGLVHQSLLAVLGAVAGVMAVLFLDMPGGPQATDTIRLFDVLGYGFLVISVVLALRVLVVVFREERP
jgi:ubiquinone biosynthesis protein